LAEKATFKNFEKAKEISSGAIPSLPPSPSRPRLPGGPGWGAPRQSHSLGGAVAWRGLARKEIKLEIKQYANEGVLYAMAARSKVVIAGGEPFGDRDFTALKEDDESPAEELHALVELEKGDFISLDEYLKRRGIE